MLRFLGSKKLYEQDEDTGLVEKLRSEQFAYRNKIFDRFLKQISEKGPKFKVSQIMYHIST